MKPSHYKNIVHDLNYLNTWQFRNIKQCIKSIDDQQRVANSIETPYRDIKCPHCNETKVQRWGKCNGLQRYRCKNCRRTFNSLTGTPLARLRKKEIWIDFAKCMNEGLSVRKSASICKVNKNTTFRWRHRFLKNAKEIKSTSLHGIVEADETYFLRSEKGSRNLKRKPRKRGGNANKPGISMEHVCLFVSRDRNKNTYDKIFDKFNSSELDKVFNSVLSKDSLLCSDTKSVYISYTKKNNIRHGRLNISNGEHVKKDIVHVQNVNLYHSRLKEWISRFHGVATKYLDNYVSWFRELDEFSMDIRSETIINRAKSGGKYRNQYLSSA